MTGTPSNDPAALTASEALAAFRARTLSPVELMRAVIARAERINPTINALSDTYFDEALQAARAAEARYASRSQDARPLEGLPLAVKDEMSETGRRITMGSLLFKDRIGTWTDAAVQRLKDAGAIAHVRTITPEFSLLGVCHSRMWGVSRNPHNRAMTPGDLVLMDAGAEFDGYASDVTRTFPIDRQFSGVQRDLYQLVLGVQQAAIANAKPGIEYKDLHLAACAQMASGLADLGLLKGAADELVERDAHALFFPHGLGHMLGLSTHDAGGCLAGRTPSDRFGLKWLRADLPLEPGYVVTIEPGVYFIKALRHRQASLLAAGVVEVSGGFVAGEPVDIVATDGTPVARGLVSYDAAEFDRLIGRTTSDLIAEFGPDYEREIVHRDDLVVL